MKNQIEDWQKENFLTGDMVTFEEAKKNIGAMADLAKKAMVGLNGEIKGIDTSEMKVGEYYFHPEKPGALIHEEDRDGFDSIWEDIEKEPFFSKGRDKQDGIEKDPDWDKLDLSGMDTKLERWPDNEPKMIPIDKVKEIGFKIYNEGYLSDTWNYYDFWNKIVKEL